MAADSSFKRYVDMLNGKEATAFARVVILMAPVLVPVGLYASRAWFQDQVSAAPVVVQLVSTVDKTTEDVLRTTERVRILEEAKRATDISFKAIIDTLKDQKDILAAQSAQSQRIEAQLNRITGALEATGTLRASTR